MRKLWVCFLIVALTAGVSMGENARFYNTSRRTSEPQLDRLISNGWIVVNGTVVTPENKDQVGYTDWADNRTYVGDFMMPPPPLWTNGVTYGDPGTGFMEDFDHDGALNLYEYALNGDLQSSDNRGTEPVFVRGAGGTFEYSHVKRTNDPSLVYLVEARTNLLSGGWINTGYSVLSTNVLGGNFVEVKYSIPATEKIYIRLKILMPTP